ncbi:hypothetical protein EXS70_00100 [Candidatus Peribacteria bacterium]|nr:hypothetical protein [Candidatus Peribacteria bacterium]
MSSSTSNSDHWRYLFFLALFSAPVVVLLALNFLFLRNSGELLPVETIVSRQMKDPRFCIYGDALRSLTYPYKMEAYNRKKPTVVVIGSSRMLQFRERFFAEPFYNFGSAMTNVNEGMDLVDGILRSPTKPETVILGIDFWWFNGKFVPPVAYRPTPKPVSQFNGYFLFKPFQWLWQGKITLGDYVRTVLGKDDEKYCNIGIAAIKNRTGFGPDGSHYYDVATMKTVSTPGTDAFGEVPDVIADQGRFGSVQEADATHKETFFRLVDRLQDAGIEVVALFPPFPPPIYAAMKADLSRYAVFEEIKQELIADHVLTLDLTNPANITSSACEFLDSVHGGDVTAARILQRLDQLRRTLRMPRLGNATVLQQTIEKNVGRSMARDARVTDTPEVDFLNLGCEK